MGPIFLVLLIIWYLSSRFGSDLKAAGQWLGSKLASGVAAGAGKVGAAGAQKKATEWAQRLRPPREPGTPRTATGQRLRDTLTAARGAAQGIGGFGRWLRVATADAVAAARAAQRRRESAKTTPGTNAWDSDRVQPASATGGYDDNGYEPPDSPRRPRWWSLPDWLKWPSGRDPEAPVQATAKRMDRDDPAGIPALPEANTDPLALPAGDTAPPSDVIDAELVDEPPPLPALTAPPALPAFFPATTPVAALTTGRNPAMDTAAAERGLSAYLAHSAHMASELEQARNSTEITRAAMERNDWSGVPVDNYTTLVETLGRCVDLFNQANASLDGTKIVEDAYRSRPEAGVKEDILA